MEKQVQKYEAEIRNHVRIEQQLRLYAENLENQNQEIEKLQKNGSDKLDVISNLSPKKKNQQLKDENKVLKAKITESESAAKKLQDEVNLATKRSSNNLSKQFLEKRIASAKRTGKFSNASSSKENLKDFNKKQRDIIQDLVRNQSYSNEKPLLGRIFHPNHLSKNLEFKSTV